MINQFIETVRGLLNMELDKVYFVNYAAGYWYFDGSDGGECPEQYKFRASIVAEGVWLEYYSGCDGWFNYGLLDDSDLNYHANNKKVNI
ncbi:hypothetical protein [Metabacillus fastidiosus]|uniref:Uncharacterized protein n=1 Tax=Metabacillus fastidiosus TaxID=1458 RepID=A0ABU6NUI9_9BACI|nr:hypothetical protein [Metabacillus fastidiosus]MED4400273.1 hypothetical protein [Metabacillus fastidiosus]